MKHMDISHMKPEDCENEIRLFQNISHLSHPNIVKYETSYLNYYKKKCIIIMEYCGGKRFLNFRRGFEWYNKKPYEETPKNSGR